jgi:hypothetical protein
MATIDPAKTIMDALEAEWADAHPTWTATLHVDDDYRPAAGAPTLLVADDGGPAVHAGPWMVGKTRYTTVIRLTAFAMGRDEARNTVTAAADWLLANRPDGIGRIEAVTYPLIARDRKTGAFLAWLTARVSVRQSA